jgi:RNA polymerase sigma-70 factor (ECF subfamily)
MSEAASKYLVERWRAGDQSAAAELFQRYAERLVALAQRHLHDGVAHRIDAEDVVQSVYQSFFIRAREGNFILQESGDLWRLLVTITLNKIDDEFRRHTAAKRSVGRESLFGSEDSLYGLRPELLAREPSPAEVVALTDQLQQLLAGLDPLRRQMVEMSLQGCELDEIAIKTGYSQRTVRRLLNRVKQQLEWDSLDGSEETS